MDKTGRVVIAVIVAAITFSCCAWSGWAGGLGTYGPWGLYAWDLYPAEWWETHTHLWLTTNDFLSLVGKLTCFGAPAWAAILGGIAYWVLGIGRDD